MSAYDELRSRGKVGPEALALLRTAARGVVTSNSFPPPGPQGWTDDAVDDLISAKLASDMAAGRNFVMSCVLSAKDDASLGRLLAKSFKNYLIDEAKKTPRGKLRRRLDGLLEADPRFARGTPSNTWAPAESKDLVWQGDIDELLRAAFRVRGVNITPDKWNFAGPTPVSTQRALLDVADAVLQQASGAVREEDLAGVIEQRFPLLAPSILTSLDVEGLTPPATEVDLLSDLVAAETSSAAEQIWQSLTQQERSLLPHLGKPAADMAQVLGTGPKKAQAIAEALEERLRLLTRDDEARGDVVRELYRLCEEKP